MPQLRPISLLLSGLLVIAALALGGWHISRFAAHSQAALNLPYPLDGQEGTLLSEARLVRAGEALYQPLRPDRVIGAPYPPLHYLALAAVEPARDPASPLPNITQEPVFQAGRLVSLGAMLGIALLLGLAVWRIGGSLLIGLVAVCLWLAFPPVQLWATRIKPDPLALLLTAAGVLAMACYLSKPRGASRGSAWLGSYGLLLLAAAAFALAFFTKQTTVAAPAASGLTLLLIGNGPAPPRMGGRLRWLLAFAWQHLTAPPLLIFAGSYALLVAMAWLGLDLATGGQFTYHVWGLHPPEWWTFPRFRRYLNLLLTSIWPLGGLAAAAFVLALGRMRLAGKPSDPGNPTTPAAAFVFCACYALLGTLTVLAAGTAGSHHNHLLEPQLALSLAGCSVAGAATMRLGLHLGRRQGQPTLTLPHALVSLAALVLLLTQLWTLRERPTWYGGEFDMERQNRTRFIQLIMSQSGEVLADDVGLLVAAGRPLRYNDPATMGPAIRTGLWDQSTLLSEVAARRFSLILMPFDTAETDVDPSGRWSPEFITTLKQHYQLLYRDVIFSYVPK